MILGQSEGARPLVQGRPEGGFRCQHGGRPDRNGRIERMGQIDQIAELRSQNRLEFCLAEVVSEADQAPLQQIERRSFRRKRPVRGRDRSDHGPSEKIRVRRPTQPCAVLRIGAEGPQDVGIRNDRKLATPVSLSNMTVVP